MYETKGNKFQLMNLRTEKGRKLKTKQKTKEKKNFNHVQRELIKQNGGV